MGKVHSHPNGALGPLQVFSGQASTQEVSVTLEVPCRFFSLQVVKSSTNAVVSVTGHLAPSSLSTGGVALLSWAASTVSGAILSTESTGALSRLSINHSGGASSGGLSVWITASP